MSFVSFQRLKSDLKRDPKKWLVKIVGGTKAISKSSIRSCELRLLTKEEVELELIGKGLIVKDNQDSENIPPSH